MTKELKEPRERKVKEVKPMPTVAAWSDKLRKVQAKTLKRDTAESKVKAPREREPEPVKDYLPAGILTSFAQEVGSRNEQAAVAKVLEREALSKARKIRDAEVSRADAQYSKVRSKYKLRTALAKRMAKVSEMKYDEASKPSSERWTLRQLIWHAARSAIDPEVSRRRARRERERRTEEALGTPFRRAWGWQ
jgi:hypothetical protein